MYFRRSGSLLRLRLDFANLDIPGTHTIPQPRRAAWIVTNFLVSASIQHFLPSQYTKEIHPFAKMVRHRSDPRFVQ